MMDQAQFAAVQATFPWREQVIPTARGGIVQVIDRNGHEVPLFVMTQFLELITNKLAVKPQESKEQAA